MVTFDKITRTEWESNGIKDISLFFYESGCAGTKIQVEQGKSKDCTVLQNLDGIHLYMKKDEVAFFEGGRVTRTGNKWIFTSEKVNTRCGCGSSFSLKSKSPLQDKVARMKLAIKQKKDGIHL